VSKLINTGTSRAIADGGTPLPVSAWALTVRSGWCNGRASRTGDTKHKTRASVRTLAEDKLKPIAERSRLPLGNTNLAISWNGSIFPTSESTSDEHVSRVLTDLVRLPQELLVAGVDPDVKPSDVKRWLSRLPESTIFLRPRSAT